MTREEALNYAIVKVLSLEHGRELVGDECKSKFQDELDFYHAVIRNLSPITREQVEKMRGEWIHDGPKFNGGTDWYHCSKCGAKEAGVYVKHNFCSYCGQLKTDEAVDMVMERLEEMHADRDT